MKTITGTDPPSEVIMVVEGAKILRMRQSSCIFSTLLAIRFNCLRKIRVTNWPPGGCGQATLKSNVPFT